MKLNYKVDLKIFMIPTFLILVFSSCGINNYYYNELGSLRPKRNVFNNKVLELVDYTKIDTNSIYVSSTYTNSKKWFYKFYSKNKVGYGFLVDSLSRQDNLNPKRLKMGYFEIKDQKLFTNIFINRGYKTFNGSESFLYQDSIVKYYTKDDYQLHKREKLIYYNHEEQPDW